MVVEENKEVVRRFIDAYNKRNLDAFDDLVSPDYIDHTHKQQGREEFKQLFTLAFDAFPDWHEAIEDIISEGDKVWVRVKATGTHTGEWNHFGANFPPTGKKLSMNMVFNWRIVNGKIVEGGEVDDQTDFLKQLGAIEYTEEGKKLLSDDIE
ncbi:MAG: ester cyclase [Halobacteriota archaeon]|nr:ester cyclase [Halobacteriota archaeon]